MDQARKLQERWWKRGNIKWLNQAKDILDAECRAGNITESECQDAKGLLPCL